MWCLILNHFKGRSYKSARSTINFQYLPLLLIRVVFFFFFFSFLKIRSWSRLDFRRSLGSAWLREKSSIQKSFVPRVSLLTAGYKRGPGNEVPSDVLL